MYSPRLLRIQLRDTGPLQHRIHPRQTSSRHPLTPKRSMASAQRQRALLTLSLLSGARGPSSTHTEPPHIQPAQPACTHGVQSSLAQPSARRPALLLAETPAVCLAGCRPSVFVLLNTQFLCRESERHTCLTNRPWAGKLHPSHPLLSVSCTAGAALGGTYSLPAVHLSVHTRYSTSTGATASHLLPASALNAAQESPSTSIVA